MFALSDGKPMLIGNARDGGFDGSEIHAAHATSVAEVVAFATII